MKSRKLLYILLPLVAIIIYFIVAFNGLVKKEEDVKKNWSEVQNVYQRRADLIPNLVSIVKGSSDYEREVLRKLTEARAKAASVNISGDATFTDYQKQEQAQSEVASSMNRVIAVVEDYPDLKSTKSYIDLMAQLKGTERRVKVARKDFNESIATYNKSVRQFPSSLPAKLFGFKARDGFSADANAGNAVEVKF